jgi:hypothetical protein
MTKVLASESFVDQVTSNRKQLRSLTFQSLWRQQQQQQQQRGGGGQRGGGAAEDTFPGLYDRSQQNKVRSLKPKP